MRILAVNAGSSSLKLSVVGDDDRVENEQETGGGDDPIAALRDFAARMGDVDAVAHRLVHGGAAVRHAALVDDDVRRLLDAAVELAPLHVPPALALLDAARASIDRPQIVCVDTAFHATIPDVRHDVCSAGGLAIVGCAPLWISRPVLCVGEPAERAVARATRRTGCTS